MKARQKFTKEYLEHCRSMSSEQIAHFLEEFRILHGERQAKDRSRLISMKVPVSLLNAFRTQCELQRTPYQTQIKALMAEWLLKKDNK